MNRPARAKPPTTVKRVKTDASRLEEILEVGADLKHRTLYFNGYVDEESTLKFIVGLRELERASLKPVTVFLNSPGGSSYDGLAVYDALKSSKCDITIIGTGQVMSMGTIILQGGKRRLLTPEARFMIHHGSWYMGEAHASVVISSGKEMESMNLRYVDILAQRATISASDVDMMCHRETYMSAGEAVQFGFADGIYPEPL